VGAADGAAAVAVLRPVLVEFVGHGERTGPLAAMYVLAAALVLEGVVEPGATLLAAVDALGMRIGFHPVRMDPIDAPHHRSIVTSAVGSSGWDRAQAAAATLTFEDTLSLALAASSDVRRQDARSV
jgi:hypothetical protein